MKKRRLHDLLKPKRVELESSSPDNRYGKFVAEPLERGFGLTLGNAFRRVLLSSLQGSAVTAISIDGVMHEFSTISGVVEDVTQIVLNLKEVVTLLEDKDEAQLRVEVTGPCDVKAGMLAGDPSVSILNPELKICTVGEGARFAMTVTVKIGRGYVSAEKNKVEGAPVGTIAIDSVFSPVRKVNHNITNARVGQRTDYDKLVMEIWTDGTIDARGAVAEASLILRDQLAVFISDELVVEEEKPREETPKNRLNDQLFRRIEEIELSVRSANCLENADIKYIGELVQKTEAEMLRTKNFGRKSLNEIKAILTNMGLQLGMKLDGFPTRPDLDQLRERPEQ